MTSAPVADVMAGLVSDEDFGDSHRLTGLADAMQDFAVELLDERHEGVRRSLSAGDPAVRVALPRDPTVRAAIESAWRSDLDGASADSGPLESIIAASFAATREPLRPPLLAPWPEVPTITSSAVACPI